MKKFSYLMLIVALSVAGCAGYFSVWGLSQLFAGASTSVIIMASILELGKVITTTALHRYWTKLATSLKVYLTISVVVLMLITSAGIYGFLSNAYQSTANKLEIHEGEVALLDTKKTIFEKNIKDNEAIISTKNKRISQLTDLRNKQENRLDSAKTVRAKDKVRADILLATNEIQKLSNDIDGINIKNATLSDSIGSYNLKVLNLKSNTAITGEVGPLKYISELTGTPMSKVVNYLILLLIFVFDPLAIALILMTNKVIQINSESDINPIPTTSLVFKEEDIKENNVPLNEEESYVDESIENAPDDVHEITEEEPQIVEEIKPEEKVEEPITYKKEPVVPTGKIEVNDIKEIKESNRGYSVKVPQPKNTNNSIERIGSNKIIKNGDNDKFIFKRKG